MKSSPPAQPQRLSFRATIESDRLEVRLRTGSRAAGCFMLFWLAGWSVGCGLLAWRYSQDPQLETLLFAVPFWSSWLFVALFATNSFLGREVFRLDEREATFDRRLLFIRRARVRMGLEELIRFGTVDDELHAASGSSSVVIDLRTIGRPIRFGSSLVKPERDWLVYTLNQKLFAWQRTSNRRPELPVEAMQITFGNSLAGDLLSGIAERDDRTRRSLSDPELAPPSDSRWRRRDDFDSVRFALRGRFQLGAIGGSAFVCLFVNGIIAVFMKQLYWPAPSERLFGIEWLYRFLFLIPFELVGLLLFAWLMLVIVEPARSWNWTFARDQVVWRLTWFGIGFRKTYPFEQLDRLEVRFIRPEGWQKRAVKKLAASRSAAANELTLLERLRAAPRLKLAALWAPESCPTYDVVCVDTQGRTPATVEGLTFGEACWMADSLLRLHPEWFS